MKDNASVAAIVHFDKEIDVTGLDTDIDITDLDTLKKFSKNKRAVVYHTFQKAFQVLLRCVSKFNILMQLTEPLSD